WLYTREPSACARTRPQCRSPARCAACARQPARWGGTRRAPSPQSGCRRNRAPRAPWPEARSRSGTAPSRPCQPSSLPPRGHRSEGRRSAMSGTPRRYRRHMTAEDVIDQAREQEVTHAVPISLSPSSMGTFTSCPLAFRFGYIERLPEPPSAPASKGTLVHLALQHLMWRPAEERTLDAALADLNRAPAELPHH